MKQRLEKKISKLKSENLYRDIKPAVARIDFSKNDYLGLSRSKSVAKALKDAVDQYGISSTSAQTIGGFTIAHEELIDMFKSVTGAEAAALFSSGYLANIATIVGLANKDSFIYLDRQSHASQITGAQLSKAKIVRYLHCDAKNLINKLLEPGLLVTDTVFSMSGKIAPINEFNQITELELILDDAHGFGVIGTDGLGALSKFKINPNAIAATVIPFGKAIGTSGAIVLGSSFVIDTIRHTSPALFTTALPPAIAKATTQSLKEIINGNDLRQKLQANIKVFREKSHSLGLKIEESNTAIQYIKVESINLCLEIANKLSCYGIKVQAIRPPTVSKSRVGLRIVLNARHTESEINQLLEVTFACIT